MSIGVAVERARAAALEPEQGLLRMLAQRKASRRTLEAAIRSYRLAAEVLEAALADLPKPTVPGASS